jgi:protein O-mannosyl-transferase
MGNPKDDNKKLFNIRFSLVICFFIVMATAVVYLQVLNHEFTIFDDDGYVSENPHVRSGLSCDGLVWAFSYNVDYWHPLAWLSHMMDVQLYGLAPGMHHGTNLILHILNSLVLFLFWHRTTDERWKSAFVAALFALHPINVESVAWVAERKNLLSTFFWMLSMLSYVAYARKPGFTRYLAVFFCVVLGLMAKPMLVTLPFVLLLLDYWPLGRFRSGTAICVKGKARPENNDQHGTLPVFHLILEKIPFFVLSSVSVYVAIFSVQRTGITRSTLTTPFGLRVANATVSYVKYIGKMLWPHQLAAYYPFPDKIPVWQVLICLVLLLCITVLLFRAFRTIPALGIGWLWFIGTLVPVMGLFQAGLWPAMADRWAYIPFIGLYVIIAWGIPQTIRAQPFKPAILAVTAVVLLSFLSVMSWMQVRTWQDSISLFRQAVSVNDDNALGHYNLAIALGRKGFITDAMAHHRKTLKINPNHFDARNSLGLLLAEKGELDGAIREYSAVLRKKPGFADAHNNLGAALLRQGKTAEATAHFFEALNLNPEHWDAHNNVGIALVGQGKIEAAVDHFKLAVKSRPDDSRIRNNLDLLLSGNGIVDSNIKSIQKALTENTESYELHFRLGNLFKIKGEFENAIQEYHKTIDIRPAFEQAFLNLSVAYALSGNYDRAVYFLKMTIERWPDRPDAYYYTACVYARQQKAEEAIRWLKQAVEKGYEDWHRIKSDENLAGIRNSADYQALIKGH